MCQKCVTKKIKKKIMNSLAQKMTIWIYSMSLNYWLAKSPFFCAIVFIYFNLIYCKILATIQQSSFVNHYRSMFTLLSFEWNESLLKKKKKTWKSLLFFRENNNRSFMLCFIDFFLSLSCSQPPPPPLYPTYCFLKIMLCIIYMIYKKTILYILFYIVTGDHI